MELTFLCSWEDDGIRFLEAKDNVIFFLYYKAATRSLWILKVQLLELVKTHL